MIGNLIRVMALAERLVVAVEKVAGELHELNETVYHLTFDPNCDTTLDRIHTILHDKLQAFDNEVAGGGESVAVYLARLVQAIERLG